MLLALLALAAPAYAISDEAYNDLTATAGPASISVSTSLDSCGIIDDGVVCKLNVSFNTVPDASSYSATVTRADGSVIDYGTVGPGGTSLWVPYVGAGNYSVKITAYGEPDTPAEEKDGKGDVIATGTSRNPADDPIPGGPGDREHRDADQQNVDTNATGRDPQAEQQSPEADGEPTTSVGAAPSAEGTTTTTTPECTTTTPQPAPEPPAPPAEPPADTDPSNPDEDADGIPDDQERTVYEQQMAEYQAAVAAQQDAAATPAC